MSALTPEKVGVCYEARLETNSLEVTQGGE